MNFQYHPICRGTALSLVVFCSLLNAAEQTQQASVPGSQSRVVQLISESKEGQAHQEAIIGGDYSLVVQIIGDIPPKQLESFLKDATERQALAEQLGLTERALQVFFQNTINEAVPLEILPNKLADVSESYHRLKERWARYDGSDPIIKKLKHAASNALSELDWQTADALLKQAVDRDIEVAVQAEDVFNARMIAAAESTAERAEAVLLGFQYRLAGERYIEAAELLPQVDETVVLKANYLNYAGFNFYQGGLFLEAEPLYQKGLEIRQRVLGEEHPDTATSYNNVAMNLNAQGRYDEAEPLVRKGLEIRQRVLGEEHPFTAQSYNNVAMNLNAEGRYNEAEPLVRKWLEISQRVLGEEHPDTAASYNNVALNLNAQGRYDEAEPLVRKGLEISQRVLGEEHPDTAQSYNNVAENLNAFAVSLFKKSEYKDAEPLFREALEIKERLYGKKHNGTEIIKSSFATNSAFILDEQDQFQEAESLHREALEIRLRVFGEDHLATALSYERLAANLDSQDRQGESKPLYQKALEVRKRNQ